MYIDIQTIFIILFAASLSGFLSGLLGIGGGMLTVPVLVYLLRSEFGNITHLQHIAVGTSFAIMILTIISSVVTHHYNKNIRWDIVKKITPAIILGTAVGALLSPIIPSNYLQILFIVYLLFIAFKMMINIEPTTQPNRVLSNNRLYGVGSLTGLLSSWIGIGGGSIFVPFLMRYNVAIKKCLGTSSALGFPIAVVGCIMYLISGLNIPDLPEHSLGFIYIPYFIGLSICTIIFAPIGAKVSVRSNPKLLRIFFCLLLFSIASKMLWDLYYFSSQS